eukprot:2663800-Rhodomonas_salina.1
MMGGPGAGDSAVGDGVAETDRAEERVRALQALEVCLALFLGVVYNVCALAYVLPAQRGVEVASLGALLRLLGSLHMDVG